MMLDVHPRVSCFSRMRSEGFPFIVWGSGGWTLVRLEWLVASSSGRRRIVVGSASRRRRVVNLIPRLWGKLQNLSFSKVSKQVVVQSSTGKCFVQALWYKVVLERVLCKLCSTK